MDEWINEWMNEQMNVAFKTLDIIVWCECIILNVVFMFSCFNEIVFC
jgi:hypothetical protein